MEVTAIMELMNPSCLDEKAPNRETIREFVALSGILVAMADKRLDDLEVKMLQRFVGKERLAPVLDDDLKRSAKSRKRRLRELASTLREHLSMVRRRKIVEDLCAIALADHKVLDSEATVLEELAQLLDVDPYEVDAALGRAEDPLD